MKAETDRILALCLHPRHVAGCDSCEVRRMAAVDYLLTLLDRVSKRMP